jgi:nucleotide-binding universal stress UspA family protein
MTMSITAILVYVDTSPDSDERVDVAVRLARRCDAYLTAAGVEEAAVGPRERFLRVLDQEQLSGEWQTIVGLPVSHMTWHAAGHDLLVLGQRNPTYSSGLDAPEDVILGCGRPALVVPYGRPVNPVGGPVLIAWNDSREAKRALQDALPLLALSDVVTVLLVNPEEDADIELQAEVVTHLARHGLSAFAESTRTASGVVQDAINKRAKELGAELIVMGAYGHSRLRETILGGTTHDMLLETTRTLLMSH